ncbi:MAG: NAD/NADP octopine/nopaline dehydrogenase family protein [Candidatus Ratteibacteria bacterium]
MNPKINKILEKTIQTTYSKDSPLSFCVVGAGNGGLAMAGYLGLLGFPTTLYNRSREKLHAVQWHKGIELSGVMEGFGKITLATTSMEEAIKDADIIMVTVPATGHYEVAKSMAQYLRTGQIVTLNPGRTGGALAFNHALSKNGCCTHPLIAETSTFIFASRSIGGGKAKIFRIKNSVRFATLPAHFIPQTLPLLNKAFPQFIPGDNVLSTGMENIGAIFHPALTLLNAGWIERTKGNFDYYSDGITPSIANVLEVIDAERVKVASGFGMHTVSAREWLYLTYDAPGRNLYEAIKNTSAYRGISAPPTILHRYVFEDIPMSLIPLASLGSMINIKTPWIEKIIDLANLMHKKDYRKEGRTITHMGLQKLSMQQLHKIVLGID